MKKRITQFIKMCIYGGLSYGIFLLGSLVVETEIKNAKNLEIAISNNEPITCGDTLRDKSNVYIDNYIANSHIVDRKTNVIWLKSDCKSYYIQKES